MLIYTTLLFSRYLEDKSAFMAASPNFIPYIQHKGSLRLSSEFRDTPLEFLARYTAKYGSTFRAKVFFRDITFTSDPVWMRYILQTHHKDFGRGFAYQIMKLALGNGLLVNEGESWMRQRRLAQPAFYKQRLNGLFHIMEEKANDMIDELNDIRNSEIAITDVFWKVTSDIVIATLLGGKGPADNSKLQQPIMEIQEYLVDRIRRPAGTPFMYINGRHRRFTKIIRELDEGIYDIISEKRNSGRSGNDLLTMLMEAKDADTGEQMSDKQLRDEFITTYVAGHETSSYALTWTLYLLSKNPDAYQKVKKEAMAIENIESIGFRGLMELKTIRQVLFESMRMYPPAWIMGRLLHEDHLVDNTPISKGNPVILNIYGLHHDARWWPQPNEFRPERFAPEAEKKRDKFTYIPFGAGPRMCIGNNFAIMEITMLLAKLFHHFDFELMNTKEVKPDPLITLRPAEAIIMKLS